MYMLPPKKRNDTLPSGSLHSNGVLGETKEDGGKAIPKG